MTTLRRGIWALPFVALIFVLMGLRIPLIETRGFNPDELEHMHFTWRISRGEVPYRDYFEHHTPALHYALQPIFAGLDVARSSHDAVRVLFRGRSVMWASAFLCLLATWGIGWLWRRALVGAVAASLLACSWVFALKSHEIRPDGPATLLIAVGVLLILLVARRPDHSRGDLMLLLAAGLAISGAVMFTQKVLFFGPGMAAATLASVWRERSLGWRRHAFALGALTLGCLLPLVWIVALFAYFGALGRLIFCCLTVNEHWPGLAAMPIVEVVWHNEMFLILMVGAGVGWALRRAIKRQLDHGTIWIGLSFLVPCAALAIHPAVTIHYFLLFAPFAALLAADAIVTISAWVTRGRQGLAAALALVVVLGISLRPLLIFRSYFSRGNFGTLEAIRYVIRNSSPEDAVLDSFTGLGVFRPRCFYHAFFHAHIYAIETPAQRRDVVEQLESARALPKLVFLDYQFREGFDPEVVRFVKRHYAPGPLAPIWLRLFDNGAGWWADDAPRSFGWTGTSRSPQMYFGRGWRDPRVVDGRPIRRSRTPRSFLIVPIRTPVGFTAELRARSRTRCHVDLRVNGRGVGSAEVAPGAFQPYRFALSGPQLESGLNTFELVYDHGRRCPGDVEFETLQLVPTASSTGRR